MGGPFETAAPESSSALRRIPAGAEPADAASADESARMRVPAQGTRIDAEGYRRVLGHLPTGVTVLTAYAGEAVVGMACNSFTSVSLEPPLISVCPAKTSGTWPLIASATRFCVNILAAHHRESALRFAQRDIDRFAGVSYHARSAGPALDDAVAWVDCEINAQHDAGDHVIVVATVVAMEARQHEEMAPLVFFRGQYGAFTSHASPTASA